MWMKVRRVLVRSLDDGEKIKSRKREVSDERGEKSFLLWRLLKKRRCRNQQAPTHLEIELTRQIHLKTSIWHSDKQAETYAPNTNLFLSPDKLSGEISSHDVMTCHSEEKYGKKEKPWGYVYHTIV